MATSISQDESLAERDEVLFPNTTLIDIEPSIESLRRHDREEERLNRKQLDAIPHSPFIHPPPTDRNNEALIKLITNLGDAHGPLQRTPFNGEYFQRWYCEKYLRSASLNPPYRFTKATTQKSDHKRSITHTYLPINIFKKMDEKHFQNDILRMYGFDDLQTNSSGSSRRSSIGTVDSTPDRQSTPVPFETDDDIKPKQQITIREYYPSKDIQSLTVNQSLSPSSEETIDDLDYEQFIVNHPEAYNAPNSELHQDSSANTYQNSNANMYPNQNSQMHQDPNSKIHQNPNPQMHQDPDAKIHQNSNPQIQQYPRVNPYQNPNPQMHQDSNTKIHQNSNPQIQQYPRVNPYQNPNPQMHQDSNAKIYQNPTPQIQQHPRVNPYQNLNLQMHQDSNPKIYQDANLQMQQLSRVNPYQNPSPEMYQNPNPQMRQDPRVNPYQNPNPQMHQDPRVNPYQNPNPEMYQDPNAKIYQNPNPQMYEDPRANPYQNPNPEMYQDSNTKTYKEANPGVYHDPNPEIITRSNPNPVTYQQNVSVRYLVPPTPPPPGPLIIREVRPPRAPTPPPLVIKQQDPSPPTPPPIILREAPPAPPPHQEAQIITKMLPPIPPLAPRMIIEHNPPLPPKPQSVIIEKWLPYKQPPPRQVIYQRVVETPVVSQFQPSAMPTTANHQRRHSAEFRSHSCSRRAIPVHIERQNSVGQLNILNPTAFNQFARSTQHQLKTIQAHHRWLANQHQKHMNVLQTLTTPVLIVQHPPVTKAITAYAQKEEIVYTPTLIHATYT